MPPWTWLSICARVHRAAAVVHRDDALDAHDAGLGVDRDLGELHAAQPRCARRPCRPILRRKAAVVVGAARHGADLRRLRNCAAASRKPMPARHRRRSRCGRRAPPDPRAQRRATAPPCANSLRSTWMRRVARRRRDRGRGAAAVGRRAGRKIGVADADRDVLGRRPSSSATTCASTVPMPVPMSCTLESTSTEPSRRMRTSQDALVCTLAPQQRLRHADAALDRAGVAAGRGAGGSSRSARRRCAAPRAAPGSDRCGRAARADRGRASRPARRSPARARRRPARCRARAWRSRARR